MDTKVLVVGAGPVGLTMAFLACSPPCRGAFASLRMLGMPPVGVGTFCLVRPDGNVACAVVLNLQYKGFESGQALHRQKKRLFSISPLTFFKVEAVYDKGRQNETALPEHIFERYFQWGLT